MSQISVRTRADRRRAAFRRKAGRAARLFVLLTVLIDATGMGLIFPVMPDLLEELTGQNLSGAAVWGGILGTAYAAMQFLFGPVVGNLSDAYGRRPVMLTALFVMTLDYVLLAVAHTYLDPLREAGVDTVVLGCTHYPLLTGVISYVMGGSVSLVSSSDETAKEVYRVLADHDLLQDDRVSPEHHFTTTGDPAEFTRLARRFLGPEVISVTGHRHFDAPRGEVSR